MKIDSSAKPVGDLRVTEARASATRKTEAAPGDDVQLSALSARLNAAGDGPEVFDAARVSEIKQAIAEGRFSIDAGAIADRLIASAREFIGAQARG